MGKALKLRPSKHKAWVQLNFLFLWKEAGCSIGIRIRINTLICSVVFFIVAFYLCLITLEFCIYQLLYFCYRFLLVDFGLAQCVTTDIGTVTIPSETTVHLKKRKREEVNVVLSSLYFQTQHMHVLFLSRGIFIIVFFMGLLIKIEQGNTTVSNVPAKVTYLILGQAVPSLRCFIVFLSHLRRI